MNANVAALTPIERTAADLTRNVFVVALMATVGFAVGFRVQTNVPGFVAGLALVCSSVTRSPGLRYGRPDGARSGVGTGRGVPGAGAFGLRVERLRAR